MCENTETPVELARHILDGDVEDIEGQAVTISGEVTIAVTETVPMNASDEVIKQVLIGKINDGPWDDILDVNIP